MRQYVEKCAFQMHECKCPIYIYRKKIPVEKTSLNQYDGPGWFILVSI